MKFTRNQQAHYESGPDMTPLVDVVMVLLIFLMMVGKFGGAERYLASNLPITAAGTSNTQADPNLVPKEPISISVIPNPPSGFRAFVGRQGTGDPAELKQFVVALKEGMERAGRKADDIQVLIKPSKQVRYENVVAVYAAVLDAKLTKIGFQTAE